MKNNKLTLSQLKNLIKEEIQFELTKKQLHENFDKNTLRRLLSESEVTKLTFGASPITPSTTEKFRIVNPNPKDKIKTVASKIADKTFMRIEFIYTLELSADSNEYEMFAQKRSDSNLQKFFFTTDNTSLIIPNHNDSLKFTKQNQFPYTLEIVITHSSNVRFDFSGVKGQVTNV